jgi:cob(I)alamin adenosyltransferase|tara:strand:- start:52142 stop:52711 length:570 start_codon:yes stop_codon:yes gene_type:complete
MLYTRTGDKGKTSLFGSKKRISKNSTVAEALGSLDELNSFLGLCKVEARKTQEGGVLVGKRKKVLTSDILREVQQNLFIVQAEVAGARKKITKQKVVRVEQIVNKIEHELPPLTDFSLAGGTELSALLDVARTIARRVERRVVAVHEESEKKISEHTRAYLNRLSSLLFALARLTNHRSGIKEESPNYR